MESSTTPKRATEASTIAEAFRITAADRADEVAIRTKGDAFTITWGELRERVDALARGLAGLGVERGDSVCVVTNQKRFADIEMAWENGTCRL